MIENEKISTERLPTDPPEAIHSINPAKARVLIVDDDLRTLSMFKVALELAGYDVTTTSDPRSALALVDQSQPDAIVLDIMMPEISGWEPRLVVAWLCEHEVVGLRRTSMKQEAQPWPEEIDAAVRELFQDALFRGFSLAELQVRILVAATAWERMGPLIGEIAERLACLKTPWLGGSPLAPDEE